MPDNTDMFAHTIRLLGMTEKARLEPFLAPLVFRNSLQGFVREAEDRMDDLPRVTIYSADALEVYAWMSPQSHHTKSFSFGRLLSQHHGKEHLSDAELVEFSDVTLEQLFFGRPHGFCLFEPHFKEVTDLIRNIDRDIQSASSRRTDRKVAERQLNERRDDLVHQLKHFSGRTPDFSNDNEYLRVEEILSDWIAVRRNKGADAPLVDRAARFAKHAKYYRINNLQDAHRSIFRNSMFFSEHIDPSELERYMMTQNVQEAHVLSSHKLARVLSDVPVGDQRGSEVLQRSIRRDADSIAFAQTLNDFFVQIGQKTKIEFISRSFRLHVAAALLSPAELRVPVRHPMFIPGVHRLHPHALQQLTDLSQQVDHTLRALLRVAADTGHESQHLRFLSEIALLANRSARTMFDVVVAKYAIQSAGTNHDLERDVVRLSEDLMADIRKPDSAIKERATREVYSHISGVPRFLPAETQRPFVLRFRINRIKFPMVSRDGRLITTIRPIDSKLPRLFLLFSERWASALLGPEFEAALLQETTIPVEVTVDVDQFIREFMTADVFSGPLENVESVDAALLQALFIACRGWYSVAASTISMSLRDVARRVRLTIVASNGRQPPLFAQGTDTYVPLAIKELYLLRHFCERVTSRKPPISLQDALDSPEGGKLRNVARAQRDLDLAVYMTEEAARLAESGRFVGSPERAEWRHHPAAVARYSDARLRLIHAATWFDLFFSDQENSRTLNLQSRSEARHLLSEKSPTWELLNRALGSIEKEKIEGHAHRARYDIWTAAGIIKELEVLAYEEFTRRPVQSETTQQDRSDRHHAYIEAQAFSLCSLIFVTFVSFGVSREVQAVWNPWTRITHERLFVLRNWRFWMERLFHLSDQFKFVLGSLPLLRAVYEALVEIDRIRNEIASSRLEDKAIRVKFYGEYIIIFNKMIVSLANEEGEGQYIKKRLYDNEQVDDNILYRITKVIIELSDEIITFSKKSIERIEKELPNVS